MNDLVGARLHSHYKINREQLSGRYSDYIVDAVIRYEENLIFRTDSSFDLATIVVVFHITK